MHAKLINDDPERTYAIVLDTGDEVVPCLEAFAQEHSLVASRFTAIGAFRQVTLGYFDWERKAYDRIELDEQLEVLSLIGDITLQERQHRLHAHAVLGRHDAQMRVGHLLHAVVRPTLEVLLTDSPSYLRRELDPASGLPLSKF